MKKSIIKSERAQERVANLVVKKLRAAMSIFSTGDYSIQMQKMGNYWIEIVVENKKEGFLTMSEIEEATEVMKRYKEKYEGIHYVIETRPYLAKDGETWLSRPVIEMNIRRVEC